MDATQYKDWGYDVQEPGCTWGVLLPPVLDLCSPYPPPARVLDVGCGSGYLATQLLQRGYSVVGIDLSQTGIDVCRKACPSAGRFEVLPADDRVLENLGESAFDLVISTETIEHLYDPQAFARGCFAATRPGGRFICSTPYHGYFKNLALSLTGKWDRHLNPMWQGGHIKFWSRATLTRLLSETGFENIQFRGAGRAPYIWMSMVLGADRPKSVKDPS